MHRISRVARCSFRAAVTCKPQTQLLYTATRRFSRTSAMYMDPITRMALEAEQYAPKDRTDLEKRVVELEKEVENKDVKIAEKAIDELTEAYKSLHMHTKALELMKRHALGLKKEVHGTISREVAKVYSDIAALTRAMGSWREALVNQQASIEIKTQLFGYSMGEVNDNHLLNRNDRFELAHDWDTLGVINHKLANGSQAQSMFDRSLKLFEADKNQKQIPLEYIHAITHAAELYYSQANYEQAYELYERARVAQSLIPTTVSQQDVADAMSNVFLNMANCAMYTSRIQEAEGLYKRAVQVLSRAFGSDHDRVGSLYYSLGVLYASRGDLPNAERYTTEALAILEKEREVVQQRDHYRRKLEIAKCFLTLGSLCVQSDPEKAENYFKKSLQVHSGVASGGSQNADISETHSQLGGRNSLDVAYIMEQLGRLAALREDYEASLNYTRKALVIAKSIKDESNKFGANHVAASALMSLGSHYLRNNEHQEAENHFNQSYESYTEASPNEYHPDVAELCFLQARNYFALKKYKDAKRKCEDARDVVLGAHESPFHPLIDPILELLKQVKETMLAKERERAERDRKAGRVPAIEDERKRKREEMFEQHKDAESDMREKLIMLRRKQISNSA